MYHVPIPSIENEWVIKYLGANELIKEWSIKNVKTKRFESTERPTYLELLENGKWNEDKVFSWTEQKYDERGQPAGRAKRKYFSVHAYGRMLHQIHPGNNILKQLSDIPNINQYMSKHIETPDILFRNLVRRTFFLYEDMSGTGSSSREETTHQIKRLQHILSIMLWKYPSLIYQISVEKALRISTTHREQTEGRQKKHYYDSWYVRQLLDYAPFIFQRPYWSKTRGRNIKEDHNVYLYHMFTYQTKYRNGDLWPLSQREIHDLCGSELKRIRELTPYKEIHYFNKLSPARQLLTRQAFGENDANTTVRLHEQYVGLIITSWTEQGLTPYQIRMKTLEAYEKEFNKRFGYELTREYILQCIENEMKTVSWWNEEDMDRLRRGKKRVGREERARQSIPLARPEREGKIKKYIFEDEEKKVVDMYNDDSDGGSSIYERNPSPTPLQKSIIESGYDSKGGESVYENEDTSEEETKSDNEETVRRRVESINVYDISDEDEDTVPLTDDEKSARRYITDVIYRYDLLAYQEGGKTQAKAYRVSKTWKEKMLKNMKRWDISNPKKFLEEIIYQYKNGKYDGMAFNDYNYSRRQRNIWKEGTPEVKKEITKIVKAL